MAIAYQNKIVTGRKLRVDTTVVETNISLGRSRPPGRLGEVPRKLASWPVFQDDGNGVPTGDASHRGTRSADRSSSRGGSTEALHGSLPSNRSYTQSEWGWPRMRGSIRGRVLRGREPAGGPAAAQGRPRGAAPPMSAAQSRFQNVETPGTGRRPVLQGGVSRLWPF